ncbi:MAG: RidA family protein [Gemmatimonadales bacterium]|nr:RidA family protein [Gemmatimonadales bacterium]
MDSVVRRLREHGLTLPVPKGPVANYVGCKRSGALLFVSALVSSTRGAAGVEVPLNEAKSAAQEVALGLLAIVQDYLGDLDAVASVEKLNGFIRSDPEFTQQPQVLDGASDVLVAAFGDAGKHARTATGVAQLPYGATVQLEMVLRLRDPARVGT